jgi:hypothetical protein
MLSAACAAGEGGRAERVLGDLAGDHPGGIARFALDADERDTVGAGDSTKAHSPELSLATMRAGTAREGARPSSPVTGPCAAQPGLR